ncbi:MAG TPA: hypothetical protein VF021_12395 [Longimicrobiales bacterium]
MRRCAALVAVAAAALLATSCKQKPASEGKVPLTPPADSIHQQAAAATPFQLQLDSGNVAYRAKDYPGARAHYMRATAMDSLSAAGWFGVYMAEDKLGNRAQADYAMKRARELNPAFNAPVHGAPAPGKEDRT